MKLIRRLASPGALAQASDSHCKDVRKFCQGVRAVSIDTTLDIMHEDSRKTLEHALYPRITNPYYSTMVYGDDGQRLRRRLLAGCQIYHSHLD